MSILTRPGITVVACDAEPAPGAKCPARFDIKYVPDPEADPPEARAAAIQRGWISVTPPSGTALDYCPPHAFGPKDAPARQARTFAPPPA